MPNLEFLMLNPGVPMTHSEFRIPHPEHLIPDPEWLMPKAGGGGLGALCLGEAHFFY